MIRRILTLSSFVTLSAVTFGAPLLAQDYTQVEVWLMSRLPGHTADIGAAMLDHNAEFHAAAPNGSSVFYFQTGPDADKYQYVVGPRTFADIDQAEITAEHVADWENSVMRDARVESREFWRRADDLAYAPTTPPAGTLAVARVRAFHVVDQAAFLEGQGQVVENLAAMNHPYPRSVWQRIGLSADPEGWVAIDSYPNWAALDADLADFEETFRRTKGDAAWEQFQAIQARAFTARQDSYRVLVQPN